MSAPNGKPTRYRMITLDKVRQLPHIARPIDVLWDVDGVEGLFGIDITTPNGVVRIPWGQIAFTLIQGGENGPRKVE